MAKSYQFDEAHARQLVYPENVANWSAAVILG